MATIAINGANIYYESHGSGQPLILIAGYSSDHFAWTLLLDKLSQHFQVIIFDNRGVGQTTDDARELSVKLMAEDVIGMIDALDLKKPHIVGHSMGGSIAQYVAHLAPQKIDKLILLTTAPKWRDAVLLAIKSSIVMREKNIDFDLIFSSILPWLFGELFLRNEDYVALYKKSVLKNPYPQSLPDQWRQYHALASFDSRDKLTSIPAKTLVVSGLQDLMALPGGSDYLVKHIPAAKHEVLDCGHVVMYEMPRELNELMLTFLQP